MNILVILGHPRFGSFNHAIADTVCGAVRRNGHQAVFHDLYAERFDTITANQTKWPTTVVGHRSNGKSRLTV